ncbi:MAG: hypothetical protein H8E31_00440 [Planctomycetes bacterium]|nr:hypothetical protein [Planctomycetota bacterium]
MAGAPDVLRTGVGEPQPCPEERAELALPSLTPRQKASWLGLLVGVAECIALAALFRVKGGAAVYWEDPEMRLQVIAIFIGVMVLQTILMAAASRRADERDLRVIRTAPQFQAVGLLLGLAAWNIWLGENFHDQGAVPMVYIYLSLGSLFILYLSCWFAGVLLGYRLGRFHGQG